jgi:hypothetical protein
VIGLGEIIIRAEFHRLDGRLDGSVSGQHDHFGRVRSLVDAAQKFESVHARHVDVAQQHVDVALFQ